MTIRTHQPLVDPVDEAVDGVLRQFVRRAERHGDGVGRLARAAAQAAAGGKRLRPRLVIAAFSAFTAPEARHHPPPPAVTQVAAAFEVLHTAFVIHDDVIDHDDERRGRPNVAGIFRGYARAAGAPPGRAARHGEAAAILAGDLLLYEATRLIATADVRPEHRERLLALVDEAMLVSATGELADVEHATWPRPPSIDAALAAARDKTAVYSFSAPLRSGALLAGGDDDALAALAAGGRSLGLAFQLVDDLIGAFGTAEQAGRPAGADLRDGKVTAVIAVARGSESWPALQPVVSRADAGPAALLAAQDALEACGARAAVHALVEENLRDAHRRFASLPAPARRMLADLAGTIRERIP